MPIMPNQTAQEDQWIHWMPWKSNGKNGRLHTSTTQKSNALQLINEIKSLLTTSQNQCKPIARSMEIMPMHITIAPIKHWKLNEHYIPHLPLPTNKTWKKAMVHSYKGMSPNMKTQKIWDFSEKDTKMHKNAAPPVRCPFMVMKQI